jgi:serine/threonine-protein kinase RsbW
LDSGGFGVRSLGGDTALERIRLSIPRNTLYLSVVRRAAVAMAERCGFGAEPTAEIEMAVDEACANAVCHGACDDEIDVEITGDAGGLTVTVSDNNEPVAVRMLGDGGLDAWLSSSEPGGLGLEVVERFMDEVEVSRGPSRGNQVRLRKNLALQER